MHLPLSISTKKTYIVSYQRLITYCMYYNSILVYNLVFVFCFRKRLVPILLQMPWTLWKRCEGRLQTLCIHGTIYDHWHVRVLDTHPRGAPRPLCVLFCTGGVPERLHPSIYHLSIPCYCTHPLLERSCHKESTDIIRCSTRRQVTPWNWY